MTRLAGPVVLMLVPALWTPSAADAAEPMCQGRPATVVGTPGDYASGTDGPDVIVSNGASGVSAGDGDDVICVTGTTDDGYRTRVGAGEGDDSVLVTSTNNVKVLLGRGEDSFVGGDERDDVLAGEVEEVEIDGDVGTQYVDPDPDSIGTGGGDDSVRASPDDTIHLGAGDDGMLARSLSPDEPIGRFNGGPGQNFLAFDTYDGGGRWVLDNRDGSLSRDDERRLSWTGFTAFRVSVSGSLMMRGSERDEYFNADSFGTSVQVDAGAGEDEIHTWADTVKVRSIDGGSGRDLLSVQGNQYANEGSFDVDLTAGRYRWHNPDGGATVPIDGIEDVEVMSFAAVTMRGNADGNRLAAQLVQLSGPPSKRCRVAIAGAGGADRLLVTSPKPRSSSRNCPAPVLDGQAGDDVLVGSRVNERLIGGPGRDVARGGPGSDVCIAETRMGCERR